MLGASSTSSTLRSGRLLGRDEETHRSDGENSTMREPYEGVNHGIVRQRPPRENTRRNEDLTPEGLAAGDAEYLA